MVAILFSRGGIGKEGEFQILTINYTKYSGFVDENKKKGSQG